MTTCTYCKKEDDCRPYGKDCQMICFACGMLPENVATTEMHFANQLAAAGPNVLIGTEAGPIPMGKVLS